jgi:hypothetical protein
MIHGGLLVPTPSGSGAKLGARGRRDLFPAGVEGVRIGKMVSRFRRQRQELAS